jgi:hypothetical protein
VTTTMRSSCPTSPSLEAPPMLLREQLPRTPEVAGGPHQQQRDRHDPQPAGLDREQDHCPKKDHCGRYRHWSAR